MRHLPTAMVALAFVVGACSADAVIAVDVTWSEELVFTSGDQLRIHVGHPSSLNSFDRSDEAFWEASVLEFPGAVRYQLRPDGEIERVGDLQIVASVAGPGGPRAFGIAPSLVRFEPGEVRVVPIELTGDRAFELNGEGDRCVAWEADENGDGGGAIGEPNNSDCDSFPDGEDCAPFVASDPGDPEICDAIDQACDGVTLDRLPCLTGVDERVLGVHQCDEGLGDWKPCMVDAGTMLPLPDGSRVSTRLSALSDTTRDCLHAPDPLGCAGGADAVNDPICLTGARLATTGSGACEDRIELSALVPKALECQVRIIGGTRHGEWEVGFAEPNTPGQLRAVAFDCESSLVIRARAAALVPRTVLVAGQFGIGTYYFAFVRLVPGGVCGAPDCHRVFLP